MNIYMHLRFIPFIFALVLAEVLVFDSATGIQKYGITQSKCMWVYLLLLSMHTLICFCLVLIYFDTICASCPNIKLY